MPTPAGGSERRRTSREPDIDRARVSRRVILAIVALWNADATVDETPATRFGTTGGHVRPIQPVISPGRSIR
jgi:hypothetical protein